MAKNVGHGYRRGAVTRRSQTQAPNGDWIKRDTSTGQFLEADGDLFKGIRREVRIVDPAAGVVAAPRARFAPTGRSCEMVEGRRRFTVYVFSEPL